MNKLAAKILSEGVLEDSSGVMIPLHSNTSCAQAEFLSDQVRALDAEVCLEIGLAYGISALCIAEEIRDKPNARFYVIDPFQNTPSWEGLGLRNLERAGFEGIVDFRENLAQSELPKLILENVKVDFVYVDAGKRMDDILIFAHFLGRLLRVGGCVAFDDLSFPGVRKALRYVLLQDHFRLKESFEIQSDSIWRRLAASLAQRIPGGNRIFASELLLPDSQLGIAANCVVIEKISEPGNDWSWHPAF